MPALILAALCLFCVGVGVFLTRRTTVMMLCGVELMLNAANLNLVAFSRLDPLRAQGQVFALFFMVIAAAETAVLLAILVAWARQMPERHTLL